MPSAGRSAPRDRRARLREVRHGTPSAGSIALWGRVASAPRQPAAWAPTVSHRWQATRHRAELGPDFGGHVAVCFGCRLKRRTASTLKERSKNLPIPARSSGVGEGPLAEW